MRQLKIVVLTCATFALLTAATAAITPGVNAQQKVETGSNAGVLFFLVGDAPRRVDNLGLAEKTSIAAVREQKIDVQPDVLRADRAPLRLRLPLLDGRTYEFVRSASEGAEGRGAGNWTWRGELINEPAAGATLTVVNNRLAGLVTTATAVYEIVARGDAHTLVEIDQSKFAECSGAIVPKNNSPRRTDAAETVANAAVPDSGDRADVLVVYTPAVRNFYNSDPAAIAAFVQSAVDVTNTAYRNSRVRMRVRLVGLSEIEYTESGSTTTDINFARENQTIAALRAQTAADLVVFLIEPPNNQTGIAFQLTDPTGSNFAPFAYSVVSRVAAVGNLTFAHEMGHNMGLAHNPEDVGLQPPAYPYAFGHYVNGQFRTLMSLGNLCPNGCPRRQNFSNPGVFINGIPTGIPEQRDNARALNNIADIVANFVYSGSSIRLTLPEARGTFTRNQPRAVRWNSNNFPGDVRIEISTDGGTTYATLVEATANDGIEFVAPGSSRSKLARLRVSSVANPNISDSTVENLVIR